MATVLIFFRSLYRVIELQGGYDGKIANDEPSFMILEGPIIILAVLALTVFHPGLVFGQRGWRSVKTVSKETTAMGP